MCVYIYPQMGMSCFRIGRKGWHLLVGVYLGVPFIRDD